MEKLLINNTRSKIYLFFRWWKFRILNNKVYKYYQTKRNVVTNAGYSYRPFDEKRSIFVHIPKCAGVSVSKAIFGNLAGGHTTLDEYMNIFEPNCFVNYFKFTIVRNPWDRLVSSYFFLLKGGFNEQDRRWFKEELGQYSSFDDFVRNWLNKENIWKWHHFRPQYHYIRDKNGRIMLDFIGFLENIDMDFLHIKNKIGINCNLPSINKSKHSTYTSYYTDETKDIVADVYAEDIKLLGYNFDNTSIPLQIMNRVEY